MGVDSHRLDRSRSVAFVQHSARRRRWPIARAAPGLTPLRTACTDQHLPKASSHPCDVFSESAEWQASWPRRPKLSLSKLLSELLSGRMPTAAPTTKEARHELEFWWARLESN